MLFSHERNANWLVQNKAFSELILHKTCQTKSWRTSIFNSYLIGTFQICNSALNAEWCLDCFQCDSTDSACSATPGTPLAQYNKKLFCRPCFNNEKSKNEGKPICQKCFNVVEDIPLRWKGDPYHPYHFNCSGCACVMDHTGRDIGGRLYCLPCHDKQGIPICAACRRPVGK